MADTCPLFFSKRLGMLAPHGPSATAAVNGIEGVVTVKITSGRRNQRRRALYWIVNGMVCNMLNDMHSLALTEDELHDITRSKLGMFKIVRLPSGEEYKRYKSTSDRAMVEAERAVFTDKAFSIWSKWTGVEVATLTDEAIRSAA